MQVIKLLPKPVHQDTVKTPSPKRATNHADPLDFSDIDRHIATFKRVCTTQNNQYLKRIELEVNTLIASL